MSVLADYRDKYRNIAFERRDGILQMTLHTDGGPLLWGATPGSIHEQLGHAFYDVAHDDETRVLIFTGTGNVFCTSPNPAEYAIEPTGQTWYRLIREGKDLLLQFLDVHVPVISVINGPATIHPELPVLGDVVLAADDAVLQDSHLPQGVVPGDGAHVIWEHLLGINRSRAFFYKEQIMTAAEAQAAGVVSEVLPRDKLLPRAWEIASALAQKPLQTLHYTRALLTQPIKRRMVDELGHGLGVEYLGLMAAMEGMKR